MAKSGGRRGKRRRDGIGAEKKSSERKDDNGSPDETDLVAALSHVVRREILRLLHGSDLPRSPAQTAEELKRSLSTVSYHFRVLLLHKVVAAVREAPVRGAIEHFYVSRTTDNPVVTGVLERTRKGDEDLKRGYAET